MTSIIKVNNLQNQCGANTINKCGTAITVGASGDTVTLAAGASQSGFGQTYSAVSWDTTPKTGLFTAVSGVGYFCNTTSAPFTVTLPAGTAGDIVAFADYAATWQTNNLTVSPNGTDKIGSLNLNAILSTEGQSVTFVFVDSTQGWINTMDSTSNVRGAPPFVAATGGTITTVCTDYKVHTFTGPGTFTVTAAGTAAGSNTVDYMVVAGGGGGSGVFGNSHGAGGGAGGFRSSNDTCMSAPLTSPLANPTGLTATVAAFPITVGAGGTGVPVSGPSTRNPGNNSIFSTITSTGGGGGGSAQSAPVRPGEAGGSGGGGGGPGGSGGAGNTPPVSPPQGQNGGSPSHASPGYGTGGGGGAGAAGNDGSPSAGGIGGVGSFMVQTGFAGCNGTTGPVPSVRYFAGGGSGSTYQGGTVSGPPAGGGGEGKTTPVGDTGPVQGATNTGGGGGSVSESSGATGGSGGTGGSGIVIIRYKFQ
jgi:hypothetical protein